jgi:predicted RNA-binding Zn ribbon-like protein
MRVEAHAFEPRDLVGGHVALDLVNTVTARDTDPIDWLDGYARLLEWAALTGAFDRTLLRALERRSKAAPRDAARALARLRELREALREVVVAILRRERRPEGALARLEEAWREAAAHARFGVAAGRLDLRLDLEGSGLEVLRHDLALRALELLRTLPLGRTRVCRGKRCGWLFIDRSKGGQRRWCDMATCGNAAKSRRFRERHRAPAGRVPRASP